MSRVDASEKGQRPSFKVILEQVDIWKYDWSRVFRVELIHLLKMLVFILSVIVQVRQSLSSSCSDNSGFNLLQLGEFLWESTRQVAQVEFQSRKRFSLSYLLFFIQVFCILITLLTMCHPLSSVSSFCSLAVQSCQLLYSTLSKNAL